MSFAMDAYFEARLAFIDRPEARISTDDTVHPGALYVRIREEIDGEKFGLSYSLLREYDVGRDPARWKAERAARHWAYELERREPSEPYCEARLIDHLRSYSTPSFPCTVRLNSAWGGERRMRLDRGTVVLSPVAYRDLRRSADISVRDSL